MSADLEKDEIKLKKKSIFKVISLITCVSLLSGCAQIEAIPYWIGLKHYDTLPEPVTLFDTVSDEEEFVKQHIEYWDTMDKVLIDNDNDSLSDILLRSVSYDSTKPIDESNPAIFDYYVDDAVSITAYGTPYVALMSAISHTDVVSRYAADMLSPVYSFTLPSQDETLYSADVSINLKELGIKSSKYADVGLFQLVSDDNSVILQEDSSLDGDILTVHLEHFSDYFVAYKTLTTKDAWKTGVLVLIDDSPSMYTLEYFYDNYKESNPDSTKTFEQFNEEQWGSQQVAGWKSGDPDGERWNLMRRIADSPIFDSPEYELMWGVYGGSYEYPEFEYGNAHSIVDSVTWYESETDGLRHTATNIYAGIKDAKSKMSSYDDFDRFVVFSITDGGQTESYPSRSSTIDAANRAGVEVHIIGCGRGADSSGLRDFVSELNIATYRHISSASSLAFLDDILLHELKEGIKYETRTIDFGDGAKDYELELLASTQFNVNGVLQLSNKSGLPYAAMGKESHNNGICFGMAEVAKLISEGSDFSAFKHRYNCTIPFNYMPNSTQVAALNSSTALAEAEEYFDSGRILDVNTINQLMNAGHMAKQDNYLYYFGTDMPYWIRYVCTTETVWRVDKLTTLQNSSGLPFTFTNIVVPKFDIDKIANVLSAYVARDAGWTLPDDMPEYTEEQLQILSYLAAAAYFYSSQSGTASWDDYYSGSAFDFVTNQGETYKDGDIAGSAILYDANLLVKLFAGGSTYEKGHYFENRALWEMFHQLSEGNSVLLHLAWNNSTISGVNRHEVLAYKMYRLKDDANTIVLECYDCNHPSVPLFVKSTYAFLATTKRDKSQYIVDGDTIDPNDITTLPPVAAPCVTVCSNSSYNSPRHNGMSSLTWGCAVMREDAELLKE